MYCEIFEKQANFADYSQFTYIDSSLNLKHKFDSTLSYTIDNSFFLLPVVSTQLVQLPKNEVTN